MKLCGLGHVSAALFLDLDLSLTLNPSARNSRMKMKSLIKGETA